MKPTLKGGRVYSTEKKKMGDLEWRGGGLLIARAFL